jgi:hypothetical protein
MGWNGSLRGRRGETSLKCIDASSASSSRNREAISGTHSGEKRKGLILHPFLPANVQAWIPARVASLLGWDYEVGSAD